jgi:cytochrome c oxidase subunit 1
MLAAVPLNLQVHDTFFVVAHLHYVLIGGALFPLLGGIHYWFPKLTGKHLSERLGVASVVLVFVGFHLTFFPQHLLGLYGMTRRIYTYPASMGWGALNLLSTVGAGVLGTGIAVYLANMIVSVLRGPSANENPWDAATLEWATASPPRPYSFEYLPTVGSAQPLWQTEKSERVVGLDGKQREVLVTDILDASPDHRFLVPGPALWPFLLSIATAVGFIGLIFTPWAAPVGAVLAGIFLIGWFWPHRPGKELLKEQP